LTVNTQLDSSLAASFLESGQILANASNAAAVVAGIAGLTLHSTIARPLLAVSMLCWLIECWFAARVKIDASLFRQLSTESNDNWQQLDELLIDWGFPRTPESRSVGDRSRSAVALWKGQALALAIQLVTLAIVFLYEVIRSLCLNL
jgi:hypothetical protein